MKLKKISLLILVGISLASVFFIWQLKDIRYDFDIASFYPADHEDTQFFEDYVAQFTSDDAFVLMAIENKQGIFQADFLAQVDSLSRQLEALPAVEMVVSPTNIKEYQRSPFRSKPLEVPYLHFRNPERYAADSAKIYEAPHLVDFLFSRDAQSVLVFVRNQGFLDEEACRNLTNQIQEIGRRFSFDALHYSGKCITQTTFIDLVQSETRIFTTANILFLLLCLFLAYRTFWGAWIPITVVGLAVAWTMGVMVLNGKAVDFVINILPTIILIIGVSVTIHLLTNYLSQIQKGEAKIAALKKSIREVGTANLMTTFTTAFGFLTLMTSSFSALSDLGIYAAIGLTIALALTYLLIPSIILLHKPLLLPAKKGRGFWDQKLEKSFYWVKDRQNAILWASGLVLILGILGASYIKLNTHILQDLRPGHKLKKDFAFLSENFGGVRPFEMAVSLQDTQLTIFSPSVLRELEQVDRFLTAEYGLKNLISPVVLMKHANLIYQGQRKDAYRLPETAEQIRFLERNLYKYNGRVKLQDFISEDKKQARINGRIPDLGSYAVGKKNEALKAFIQRQFPDSPIEYRLTGSIHLMDLNNTYLAYNVLQGLLIAIVVIGLLFTYILKSFRMIWLSLLPNILPLLFIAGIMGFTGIDLKLSTSVIFIISFGVAVDDSIHFLSRFWQEVKTKPIEEAVFHTYMTTGKAIVLTTFILVGGFLIICVSNFLATVYIGFLIATTLLVALIADLTLLPVLLLKFYRKKGELEKRGQKREQQTD